MSARKHQPATKEVPFDPEQLRNDILREAKVVSIPSGMAADIAERVVRQVNDWATRHSVITQDDLNRKVCNELAKYHADLAYVYQNRDKII